MSAVPPANGERTLRLEHTRIECSADVEQLKVQARFAAEASANMRVLRMIVDDPKASDRARRQAALILLPHLRQENGRLLRVAILKRKTMILELEREIAELQDRLDHVHLGPPTS
jgi:hypothetical protein